MGEDASAPGEPPGPRRSSEHLRRGSGQMGSVGAAGRGKWGRLVLLEGSVFGVCIVFGVHTL